MNQDSEEKKPSVTGIATKRFVDTDGRTYSTLVGGKIEIKTNPEEPKESIEPTPNIVEDTEQLETSYRVFSYLNRMRARIFLGVSFDGFQGAK